MSEYKGMSPEDCLKMKNSLDWPSEVVDKLCTMKYSVREVCDNLISKTDLIDAKKYYELIDELRNVATFMEERAEEGV